MPQLDVDPRQRGAQAPQELSGQQILFPSQELREDLRRLGTPPDKTPTDLIGMSSKDIARLALQDQYGGVLRISFSAISPPERERILAASGIDIPMPDGTRKATIVPIGDTSEEGWFNALETRLLRRIVEEALGSSDDADTIGRRAYRGYIHTLFNPENPEMVEMVRNEWNSFIASRNVASPLLMHHFRNVGLTMTEQDGVDPLRDRTVGFVTQTMADVGDLVDQVFALGGFNEHENPVFNTPEDRRFALGMAFLSNAFRGAGYYRYWKGADGEKYVNEYAPRSLAAQIIDRVTVEFNAPAKGQLPSQP